MSQLEGFDAFVGAGGSLAMLAGIEAADIQAFYDDANRMYADANVATAARLYELVVSLDAWHFDGWLALGICRQREGRHRAALQCFAKAGVIRWRDPRAPYLASVSYLDIGKHAFACRALRAALRWSRGDAAHASLHRHAGIVLERIQRDASNGI